jgi:penicillin-binding protein 1A
MLGGVPMASKDYDDLLESFMNNSAKAYKEDEISREESAKRRPSSYNEPQSSPKKSSKIERGRNIEKELEAKRNKRLSKRRAKPEKTPVQKFFANVAKAAIGVIMVFGVVGIVCFSVIAIYGYTVVYGDPVFDLNKEATSQNQTSFLYGNEGDNLVEITRLHGEENRIWVELDDMSKYMSQAFVAIEDKRFYKHHGVDWIRTIGVFVKQNNQGGSTITQQLIKNLTDDNKVTYIRKFNEILRALNLERNYSKDEILEAYLNTIYLSNGCYGVKTASEVYFGKEVKDLNAAECASIAAITNYPSKYDPLNNPENNKERQSYILTLMHAEDCGFLNDEEYEKAKDYKLIYTNSKNYKGSKITDKNKEEQKNEITSYYVDYVITTVQEDLQKMGYTSKKAHDMVYGGGLKIYTAIDFNVQDALEDVYENYRRMPDETVQGAMCVMNYSGRVLGIVGGTGKKKAAMLLNRATQSKRPPGSTIKPLSVYGPALEKSKNDDDTYIYWSTIQKDAPFMQVEGKGWPVNEGGSYSSRNVSLQYGLSRSLNTISARTLDKIGVDYSFEFLSENFHLSTLDNIRDSDYGPLAIGSLTNGATVLDMTAAYAAYGNGGYYYEPYCYFKIEDSQGNIIINKEPEKTKTEAISESTSWLMNKLMQTVLTEGTGTSYRLSGVQAYGKTGTTNDNKDRWFIGGTPNYIAATWYGYDTPKEVHYYLSPNPAGTIWNLVMQKIYANLDSDDYDSKFPEYEGIVQRSYCPYCGKLRSGSGEYGWYDVDNLPGYCNGGHAEEEEEKEKEEKEKEKEKKKKEKEKKSKTTTKKSKETTQATTKATTTEATTQPPQTTQAENQGDSSDNG